MQYGDSAPPPVDPYTEAYTEAAPAPAPAASDPRDRDLPPPPRGRSRSRSPARESSFRKSSPASRRPPHAPIVSPRHMVSSCNDTNLAKQAPNPSNVLGVFGLSIRTVERDLDDEFSRFGRVEKVTIVYDQRVSDYERYIIRLRSLLFKAVRSFSWIRIHQHVHRRRGSALHQRAQRRCM